MIVGCGECPACLSGHPRGCRSNGMLGITRWGGYAQYCVAPEMNAYPIPDGLDFPDAVTTFLASEDGTTFVVASVAGGAQVSRDAGMTWELLPGVPHMMCGGVRDADEDVFVCSDNWQPDSMAVGRSSDGG